MTSPDSAAAASELRINPPDVSVLDQHGRRQQFFRDLVAGRSVAVNFIFTSCTSICSPLSATFQAMQAEQARRLSADPGSAPVQFISVSVDPLTDTPAELLKFSKPYNAGSNWTFVTGSRASIDAILKAFGVANGDPSDHTPMVFLGHEPNRRWLRTYGLAQPTQLLDRLAALRQPQPAATAPSATTPAGGKASQSDKSEEARALANTRAMAGQLAAQARVTTTAPGTRGADYFTNLPLMTQDRPRVRFYDDLIRNRVVLITSFYATCKDVCSPVTFNLAKVQAHLEQAVDAPVQLISITTDAGVDTPEALRGFAERHGARPGWAFVGGKKENVDWVLHKLGLYNEKPDQHTAVLWVGNDRTGAWLKLHALAPPEAIVEAVRKVL